MKQPRHIFVSYRRDDSRHAAGRLVDRVLEVYPRKQVFMDVDSIEAGHNFRDVLETTLGSTALMLVVIGPHWLTVKSEDGTRRLENPCDFVRLEVETALQRDIRVIPVLIDGAASPREQELPESLRPLTNRQAMKVEHATFHSDTERIIEVLRRLIKPPTRLKLRYPLLGSIVGVLLGLSIGLYSRTMISPAHDTVDQIGLIVFLLSSASGLVLLGVMAVRAVIGPPKVQARRRK